MKIVSYNINGIRASAKLGLIEWIKNYDADVYCFQEVRANENVTKEILYPKTSQLSLFGEENNNNVLKDYIPIYNCGDIAGYAGTLILTKHKPDKVMFNMSEFWQDNEGRTTTIILGNLAIVDAYIPNGNSRLEFKMQYLSALIKYLKVLGEQYKVVCVGDFNIAHNEIDLTNPKECKTKSVFLPVEREAFNNLLKLNLVDCFRYYNPETVKYSWRSYRSRQDNSYNSWKYRIDYALLSASEKQNINNCDILELDYSDHLPVMLDLKS